MKVKYNVYDMNHQPFENILDIYTTKNKYKSKFTTFPSRWNNCMIKMRG